MYSNKIEMASYRPLAQDDQKLALNKSVSGHRCARDRELALEIPSSHLLQLVFLQVFKINKKKPLTLLLSY